MASDQLRRLQHLLRDAARDVPYYRRVFGAIGLDQRLRIDAMADLSRIPILDKETVRRRSAELVSTAFHGPVVYTHTSGTTGTALHLRLGRDAFQRSQACFWHQLSWFGVAHPARMATLAGHPVAPPERLTPPFWVTDYLEGERFFSSQHLTDSTLPLYAGAMSEFLPKVVRGYPSSLSALAAKVNGDALDCARPNVVVASSETLFERQRAAIHEAFRSPVVGFYSSAERVAHIVECEASVYHVLSDTCVVEVLRADGSPAAVGEEGELVCTGLLDAAMPLVRYRTGDTAIPASGTCACGRRGQVLSTITGRVEDAVVTPDGRTIGRLDHAFKDALNVKEAQLVQDRPDHLVVRVVPREGYSVADELSIKDELLLRLGPSMHVEFSLLDAIPREPNGKLRFVVSTVGHSQGSTTQPRTSCGS